MEPGLHLLQSRRPVEALSTDSLRYLVRNAQLQGASFVWTEREKAAWQELRRRGEAVA